MADRPHVGDSLAGYDSTHPWTPTPSSAPGWFTAALGVPAESHTITVEGATVAYRTWGDAGKPGLVFVHGGGAHSYWWTHIAAMFAQDHRIAALDLTGHGDSDHRASYSVEQWTREVMAVADASDFAGPPVVIGHSMGGMVAIVTAAVAGEGRLAGAIVGDSPVTEPDPEVASARLGVFRQAKVYPSLEAALPHFRTVPAQDHYLDYVVDHVARHSLCETDGGWRWKFDPNLFSAFEGDPRGIALPYLGDIHCRLALLAFENGLLTEAISQFMYDRMGRVTPVVNIPEAGHHAMLDQPLLLITAIRALLADWDHSTPILTGRDR
ncbi:MAG: alpha/beta hydrolase [Actinobacteria bacterium]|nr:alpha/beta hydrolase [Actinomycetota bacterium]